MDSIPAALHELAEGLQATGGYLSALRRGQAAKEDDIVETEIIDRALAQWARARHALRELQVLLEQDRIGSADD